MDWPVAAVLISGILSALTAYALHLRTPPDSDTNAFGFHADFIGRDDDEA
jgi:hypothetical protein